MDLVVSLLDDSEIAELELAAEGDACAKAGMRFVRFPIPDRGIPDSRLAATELAAALAAELRGGRGVGIHCRMGIGRSSLMAVCVLISLGVSAESAWASVKRARGLDVPDTAAQRDWTIADS